VIAAAPVSRMASAASWISAKRALSSLVTSSSRVPWAPALVRTLGDPSAA